MDVKNIAKLREQLYEAVMALEVVEEQVNVALEAIEGVFVGLNHEETENAVELESKPEDDPLCGICGNPKSKHKPDGGFVPREEPKPFDTTAETRNFRDYREYPREWEEFYELMDLGGPNER